jgi:hypothetical protein
LGFKSGVGVGEVGRRCIWRVDERGKAWKLNQGLGRLREVVEKMENFDGNLIFLLIFCAILSG